MFSELTNLSSNSRTLEKCSSHKLFICSHDAEVFIRKQENTEEESRVWQRLLQTQLSIVLGQGRERLPEKHEGAGLLLAKRWGYSVPSVQHWWSSPESLRIFKYLPKVWYAKSYQNFLKYVLCLPQKTTPDTVRKTGYLQTFLQRIFQTALK